MHPVQRLLPGLPPPDDPPADAGPALDLHAALDRLADIHRRMDRLAGAAP